MGDRYLAQEIVKRFGERAAANDPARPDGEVEDGGRTGSHRAGDNQIDHGEPIDDRIDFAQWRLPVTVHAGTEDRSVE